jgi:hypothetical protein
MQWNGKRKVRLRKNVPLKKAINEESPNLERFFYALDSG